MKVLGKCFAAAAVLVMLALALPILAQSSSDQQSDPGQSWNSSTSLQDQSGATNATRIIRSHGKQTAKRLMCRRWRRKESTAEHKSTDKLKRKR